MTNQKIDKNLDEALDQAAAWHARLNDADVQETDWLAFTDWLEASDTHRDAYNRVEDMADFVDSRKDTLSAALGAAITSESSDEAFEVSEESKTLISNTVIDARSRWLRPQRWLPLAAAATFLFMVGGNLLQEATPTSIEYASGAGETRELMLADGSIVNMNVATQMKVTLSGEVRRVEFSGGEAMFTVAKDADRPFVVVTDQQEIRVVGTKFNVKALGSRLTVSVAEGIVDVSSTNAELKTVGKTRLVKGKRLRQNSGAAAIVENIDIQSIGTWQVGFLSFDNSQLQDVVGDLNRYFDTPIRMAENASSLKFSGVLKTSDQEAILLLLTEVLPISIVRTDEEITIHLNQ